MKLMMMKILTIFQEVFMCFRNPNSIIFQIKTLNDENQNISKTSTKDNSKLIIRDSDPSGSTSQIVEPVLGLLQKRFG